VKKAALGGLFGGVTLAIASLVSRLLFHRDLAGGQGWAAFVVELTSLLIAAVFTEVAAVVLAALNVHPFRRWPGRPGGRAGVR